MKIRTALVAAGMIALPAVAFAQPVDGLYVGAGIGYNYTQDQDVKSVSAGGAAVSTPGAKLTTNGGLLGLASVGMGFGNGFRVEVQGDYRNYHQSLTGTTHGVSLNGTGGFLNQTYGGFVNGLYDFDIGAPVFPYIGVGVGYEETQLSGPHNSPSSGSIAGQGILGVAFPIPEVAGLSVTAEYRFMTTFQDEKFTSGGVSAKLGPQYNHAGLIGVRYAFGVTAPAPMAAAPAAMPAPAKSVEVAPARTYLVFFDWDKSDLSARAKQIIAEAAQNAARVKVTRIEVSGYTDLSGTPAYNLKLSQRRADSVAAELVGLGVPKSEIVEMAFGETHPLVPTAQGVREPQNRRVEIVLK
jgi:outer membrane protein OmpA-like peptidoglycan-associated protein